MPNHKNTPTFEASIKKDKKAMESRLEEGNPFQDNRNSLTHIISKHVLDENASHSVREVKIISVKKLKT